MAVDGEAGRELDDVVIALGLTSAEAAPSPEPPRAARLVLVVAALGVLAVTLWGIVSGGDGSTEDDATEPAASAEPELAGEEAASNAAVVADDLPDVLTLSNIVATANEGGTELLILDLGGTPPTRLVSGSPTLDRVPDDLLGLLVQRSPDPLLMCDATHGWGTTEDVGAVTLTLPRSWFDVADGPIDVTVEGDVAGKIIACALAGGGPVEITIHGPATLVRDEIEVTETPTGLAIRFGDGPPFDATSFPDEYAAIVDGFEIFAAPDPGPVPAGAAPFVERFRSSGVDPDTVRYAHVMGENAVLVWLEDGASGRFARDADVVVCIGLLDGSSMASSCQSPVSALADGVGISVTFDELSRSAHLATPAQAERAAALGIAVDRGVIVIEIPAVGNRPPVALDLDSILDYLESEGAAG